MLQVKLEICIRWKQWKNSFNSGDAANTDDDAHVYGTRVLVPLIHYDKKNIPVGVSQHKCVFSHLSIHTASCLHTFTNSLCAIDNFINIYLWCESLLCAIDKTGQQNLTFFFIPRTSIDELRSTILTLNSDMYTEFFYQAGLQRYRGI